MIRSVPDARLPMSPVDLEFRASLLGSAFAGFAVLLCALQPGTLTAQNDRPSYTAEQATRGKAAYAQNCESCHGANLDDGEFGPPVRGEAFANSWGGKPAAEIFKRMRSMPPSNPGGLSNDAYAQILAYFLQQNGVRPGATPLPSTSA